VGEPIRVWLLGGFAPDQSALTRFFSLHYLLPFVILAVVILHIWALHIPGSGNPTGVDVKDERDTLPFHPFYTAKDGWFVGLMLLIYCVVTFFAPNYLGHPDNYIPANPLATPAEIVPEWYFWPFYAILRSFTFDFILPAKLWGVLAMFSSILLLFFLPWLDKSPVRSGIYRPVFKRFFWLLVVDVVVLGWAGGGAPTPVRNAIGQICAAYYFLHFLVILPLVSRFETTLPLPKSISESVLHGEVAEAAPAGQTKKRGGSVAAATAE
jgi:ubiquinol-cytochrome c reductase cytochrome b subunit